ncbi:cutinase domain protein [Mycobacterium xenopi 3993]|nr:cutinase domain protein [Mycobacterium xenopi 3993]
MHEVPVLADLGLTMTGKRPGVSARSTTRPTRFARPAT